jgi:hypothetical protein
VRPQVNLGLQLFGVTAGLENPRKMDRAHT